MVYAACPRIKEEMEGEENGIINWLHFLKHNFASMGFSWREIKLIPVVPIFRFLLGNNTRGIMSFIRQLHQFSLLLPVVFSSLSQTNILFGEKLCL